ncbi:MAG TPA: Asp-tRNA(Asn)/Glu-tRNA(Gln) amidotransferase subunit GatB [Deltaproteobacteria bacterium]|nr:Asp-tRNA(Asn)/Glu-tRNA(Gln) amidotransferase subunit GatB [Deltaproteobacteria bacterium]HPJ94329.1 Asp-tRNA(Asn)/Glu-tRNA(Gln) amidotransferase subunit GatB [Deltaproteobacteria bacterium]
MREYDIVIGLEVHAQLLTNTKIFCSCSTRAGLPPNTNTCPVCLGMPGILPVLNKKVVDYGIKLGLATHCSIAHRNVFARKNYFYPDLPKGYQITQYENPLCENGFIDIEIDGTVKKIGITRIHMEEDAGKNIHDEKKPLSYVDFNRAGVPLLEIVSEPDMNSTAEAVAYLKELRQILMYLEICDGNMEEGSFRCDANVSVMPKGSKQFGIRTELKNMNSFKNVQKALEYEIERHIGIVESGGRVEQNTMLWNAAENRTYPMRSKEESHDYRYFPEPDLLPLEVDDAWIEEIRSLLPELPSARRRRFHRQYGIPEYDADVLTQSKPLADYFEKCTLLLDSPKEISNWIMTEVLRVLNEHGIDISKLKVTPEMLTDMLSLIKEGTISITMAKDVFSEMALTGGTAAEIVEAKGLRQVSNEDDLKTMVQDILKNNPAEVTKYREGKTQLLGFFVGQLMKATRGTANPKIANKLIKEMLDT